MNNRNKKIRLILCLTVCFLFISTAMSNSVGKTSVTDNDEFKKEKQKSTPIETPSKTSFLSLFYRIFNNDWDYWTNPPNMAAIPSGNIGIGTFEPSAKLDVYGNIALNGVEIIDDSGQWVGDPTGLQGPQGEQGDSHWGLNGDDTYYINGSVGIGTDSPDALLDVTDGAVLFKGSIGGIPISGPGTRLMWIPEKGALRAGSAWFYEWDNISIGVNSVAFGARTNASGYYSTALNFGSKASGTNAFASGLWTEASGSPSTAMGMETIASGISSTALGRDTIASGLISVAMGYDTEASDSYSTAMGSRTISSGYASTAMGHYTLASGDYSTAMGRYTIANGKYSTAIGNSIEINGNYSVGFGLDGSQYNVADDNVMTVMGGDVGIGTTNPNSKLEVDGTIHSTSGGFKFPDGTIQTTSATGGYSYTSYISISAPAFWSAGGSWGCNGYSIYPIYSGGVVPATTDFRAPVQLPHGATVTKLIFYWYDTLSSNGFVELNRGERSSGESLMAISYTSGSSGDGTSYDSSIDFPDVDNLNYSYYLDLYLPYYMYTVAKCYNVVIQYTVTNPY